MKHLTKNNVSFIIKNNKAIGEPDGFIVYSLYKSIFAISFFLACAA